MTGEFKIVGDHPKTLRRSYKATYGVSTLVVLTALMASNTAQAAQVSLVTNGAFTVGTPSCGTGTATTTSFEFGTFTTPFLNSGGANPAYSPAGAVCGWSSTNGFNFVFQPGSASSGASSIYTGTSGNVPFQIAGDPLRSSTGGDFIAADANYDTTPIAQQVSGLTIGDTYTLAFQWGATQQTGAYTTTNTDYWAVSLGGTTQNTTGYVDPPQTFSGWMNATMSFVANATSETLSFLASTSTPSSQPPVLLLSNVSLVKAPEPASLALMATGIVGLIGLRRRRRN